MRVNFDLISLGKCAVRIAYTGCIGMLSVIYCIARALKHPWSNFTVSDLLFYASAFLLFTQIMLCILFLLGASTSLCLLVTTSYAYPSTRESAFSSVADRGGILPSDIFDHLDAGRIGSSSDESSRARIATIVPGPPVSCRSPRHPFDPLDRADCLYISTEIESSKDAKSFRVYSADAGLLTWVNRTCVITVGAMQIGYTDVFQPMLIAQAIQHVVDTCLGRGLGGITNVGPRKRFVLVVSNSRRLVNNTVAIG